MEAKRTYNGTTYYSAFVPDNVNGVTFFSKIVKNQKELKTLGMFYFLNSGPRSIENERIIFSIEKHSNRVYKLVSIGKLNHKIASHNLQWDNIEIFFSEMDSVEKQEVEAVFAKYCEEKKITIGEESKKEGKESDESEKTEEKKEEGSKLQKAEPEKRTTGKRGRKPKENVLLETENPPKKNAGAKKRGRPPKEKQPTKNVKNEAVIEVEARGWVAEAVS